MPIYCSKIIMVNCFSDFTNKLILPLPLTLPLCQMAHNILLMPQRYGGDHMTKYIVRQANTFAWKRHTFAAASNNIVTNDIT